MGVLRWDERLARSAWRPPEQLAKPTISRIDCMVMCAGFEERCTVALRRVLEYDVIPSRIIMITYQPSYAENRREELYRISRSVGVDLIEVTYDRRDPAGIGNEVASFVRGFNKVVVDVSGMSRFLIVQIVVELVTDNGIASLVILYSEPAVYYPTREKVSEDLAAGGAEGNRGSPTSLSYLSAGIFEVATDPALSSIAMPGAEIRLIAFPTFSPAQLVNLVDELQPTYTDLIHGVRAKEEYGWREWAIRKLNDPVSGWIQNCRLHSTSTLDYRETLRVLLNLYRERSMFDRLVVAPTGSKLQALAVGLFRAVLYDVQVVYPTPRVFTEPRRYTEGVAQVYSVELSLEDIKQDEDG